MRYIYAGDMLGRYVWEIHEGDIRGGYMRKIYMRETYEGDI